MKISLKIISIILACTLITIIGFIIYYSIITKDAQLDENKLINMEKVVNYYDSNGNLLFKEGNFKQVTEINDIPLYVQKAFIAVEDKRFYSHNGIDKKGLARALWTNIKSFSFREGGSTISQQLIKNTHLSNQKTVKRKLNEFKLTKILEKKFTKDEILEKYLNTIYFGDNCYGITSASSHYFGKKPSELTINEGAALAGIIKAPSNYSPYNNIEKCNSRKNIVLSQMLKEGYIDQNSYAANLNNTIKPIEQNENITSYDFNYLAKKELNEIIKDYPFSTGNLDVYLTFDSNVQEIIKEKINENNDDCDKTAIIIDKDGEIKGYYSTCGELSRQIGSTIKPLLVYAPAIENDVVFSSSPILDEKVNFNGYSPSNYNDKYYGYISVKDSLAKSLNSCAVKLLNYTGIEKSKSYLKKINFPFTENDSSLCLALGATENGVKLSELTSFYSVFLNQGNYVKAYTIKKVESQNNGTIYIKSNEKTKIFSEETTHIINDMLESTVKNGTAKKLSFTNIPLCSKTGTVGIEKGNLDAYNISYNSEQILGVWFGNKDNSLMKNSISGGTSPSIISCNIWKEFYKNKTPPENFIKSKKVCEKYIDKIELDTGNNVLLANDLTPSRYMIKALFKNSKLPKQSKRFLEPYVDGVEIELINNNAIIKLNLPEYYNAYIYRTNNNKKIIVYDTLNNNKKQFCDTNLDENTEYLYSIVPYIKKENEIVKGKEIYLDKIKTPKTDVNEWWADEFD